MTETYEHNPGDHEDPLPGPTWLVGFIGVVLFLVIALGLVALYYGAEQEGEALKVQQFQPRDLAVVQRGQLELIHGEPEWVEYEADGRVVAEELHIPIDEAMRLVVAEHGGAREGDQQ